MQKEIKQFISATCILLLLCLPTAAQLRVITGKVVGISDGDTISVLDGNKQQHKIRLDGIDAPESSQPLDARAKQSLSDLIFGRTVTVRSSKVDRYGRIVEKVTLDGKDICLSRSIAVTPGFFADTLTNSRRAMRRLTSEPKRTLGQGDAAYGPIRHRSRPGSIEQSNEAITRQSMPLRRRGTAR
ncbi:MAG: thermonuclease family protein [Acidobacteria bacterium]|nr:thermonuclease family protein [Acidobacteriota bacterium]